MKEKKILFLIASLGLLSATTKPIFADEILIAHAEVKKIVTVKLLPLGIFCLSCASNSRTRCKCSYFLEFSLILSFANWIADEFVEIEFSSEYLITELTLS